MRCAIARHPDAAVAPAARHYDYHRPTTLAQALQLAAKLDNARFIAGGTDVMVQIRSRSQQPAHLISLRNIDDLRRIKVDSQGIRIGGGCSIAEMIAHPDLADRYAVLIDAARCLGSAQIRNVATLAGNLANASPCADMAPALLVVDAVVEIAKLDGRRELPLSVFFTGPGQSQLQPGEILSAIHLPATASAGHGVFLKKRRVRMDLAIASVAVQLDLDGDTCTSARVAAGSVAPTPIRLTKVEALLQGKKLDAGRLAKAQALASQSVNPIDDLRGSAAYRRQIVGVYVKRAVQQIIERSAS